MQLKHAKILITGASDGIGAELARQLAAQGAHLALAARRMDALETVASACRSAGQAHGVQVHTFMADVALQDQCQHAVVQALQALGGLDVLVANAGISMHADFDAITDMSTFERVMRVNFFGTVWCVHAALQALKQSQGLIVGVSSLAGLVGVPGRTVYCSSKFAQTGFLEALRTELEPQGVGVTTVYPGVVDTNIRRTGLNGAGQAAGTSGLDETNAMTVDECAQLVVQAIESRKREVVMTAKGKLGRWLKLIAPQMVDNMARAALNKNKS